MIFEQYIYNIILCKTKYLCLLNHWTENDCHEIYLLGGATRPFRKEGSEGWIAADNALASICLSIILYYLGIRTDELKVYDLWLQEEDFILVGFKLLLFRDEVLEI